MSEFFLDERVLYSSEDIYNKIRIGPVEGVLKEPLQFSVQANWENIFNIGNSFVNNVAKFTNTGILNTGVWTRKFYKGGSYLQITPKMRVVNWDGDNNVIYQAKLLTDLALPAYNGKSVESLFEESKASNISEVGSRIVEGATEGLSEILRGDGAKTFNKIINELSSNSPKPVTVVISNFFRNRFIIESVQVEFSKEMTSQGPLYADFEVVLSTPEVTVRGGTGLKSIPRRFERS